VPEIADWLDKLGMSEYAQRFAENGISFTALRNLTDQDLNTTGCDENGCMFRARPRASSAPNLGSTGRNEHCAALAPGQTG
jgi:hypothetical protein